MKTKLFIVLFLVINFIHSQSNTIDSYVIELRNVDHIDCVKSIYLETLNFYDRNDKIDTLKYASKIFYDKQKVIKRYDYFRGFVKPSQIIKYDSLIRIKNIERNDGNQITETICQYFSNSSKYPDSLNIFSKNKIKTSQTINHFSNNLIIKQELFKLDTLRYYSIFKYDSKNRLVKKLNINTENGFGIILDKSFTGTVTRKNLNPNDSTFYKYDNKLDTLIVFEYQENRLEKIKKKFKNDTVSIVIEEDYWKGRLSNIESKYKWKDSLKTTILRYNDKGKLKSYLKELFNADIIISQWKHSMSNGRPENTVITKILTTNDKYGNWIKKTFIRNGFKEKEIKRVIKYDCH